MDNPQAIIADVAEEFVGKTEVTANRAPWIKELWEATNYPSGMDNREPYCSSGVTFCIKEADRLSDKIKLRVPPYFPAVAQWKGWSEDPNTGCLVFKYSSYRPIEKPQRGDIVIFDFSHCGIVRDKPYTPTSSGVTFIPTIEFNTGPGNAGSQRDGEGVFKRERSYNLCSYFFRIPILAGKV